MSLSVSPWLITQVVTLHISKGWHNDSSVQRVSIFLLQVSTVPWEWSPRPQVPHTAALLPSITSVPPTTPSTSHLQPPTALTSPHTSTLRNSTSTGTTTTPGYQVGDIQNVGGDQLRLYYQELTKDWTMRCCQTITTGTDPNQNPLNPCSTSLLRLRGHAGEDTTSDSNSFSYLLSCIVGTMCI